MNGCSIIRPLWFVAIALLVCPPGLSAATVERDLFDGFAEGWRDRWQEKKLFARATRYEVVTENGRAVLHATSRASNSGLARSLKIDAPVSARLRWEWKIAGPLEANRAEQTRAGDDFAVRLMVIFEESVVPLRTRVLNYVWAAHLPVGTIYSSPYSAKVGMVVVRSGGEQAGEWVAEERDLVADYRAFFGEPPQCIRGVAVLVDTDNTGLAGEAWFARLALATVPESNP